jgi:cytochrome c oxidase assembly protein subunit 15
VAIVPTAIPPVPGASRAAGGVSPARYRRLVVVAGASLAAIVGTGAAVRLTRAGLGCENWPSCSDDRFVPEWQFHPWIEFGNRLVSGVVALAVAVAVLAAYRRRPRRTDLVRGAWGLVAGVAAQVVLGGVTVLVDLHPLVVAAHFLLSMILLWNVVALWVRAGSGPGPARARVAPSLVDHGRALVALAGAVLVTGTVVTGTGPHGGDSRAERLSLDLQTVARVHTGTVWLLTLTTVVLALRLGRAHPGRFRRARWLVAALVAQGAVGYAQYSLGVPAGLVQVHVLGSIVVFCLALLVHLDMFERPPLDGSGQSLGPRTVNDGLVLDTMKG